MKTRDRKLIEALRKWRLFDPIPDEPFFDSSEYLQFCKENPVDDLKSNELPNVLLNNAIRHLDEEQKAQLVISLFERCEKKGEIAEIVNSTLY